MNRHELLLLQRIQGYPALTITLPTHRTSPDNRQDPIRVKNLAEQAANRLLAEFTKREIDPLLNRLSDLVEQIDYPHTLDGLALFVNRDFARAVYLPFRLRDRIVVDGNFFTRDLVFALNRTPRYWIVSLNEKPTRLFEGTREHVLEVTDEGFPLTHSGPGGELPLPGGFGVRKSAHRDERHRQFFRQVDAALRPFLLDDPLPVAVVGVDRFVAFFQEVTEHRRAIVTTLHGSHEKTPPHELGKLVWPLVKANLAQQRLQVLGELEKAVGERKFVSGAGEVWRLAHEGRGRLLLVEEDFHFPGYLDANGALRPADDPTAPGVLDDAVDDIIEVVLSKQGQVVFVDNGLLAAHQGIALIVRF